MIGICIEIDGVFYESCSKAGRIIKCHDTTIKDRCLSNNFPNYKIVPFRITYIEKRCTQCKKMKLLKEFGKRTTSKDGLQPLCKQCEKKRYENNKKEILKYQQQYNKTHKEKQKKYTRQWSQDNKERRNARRKERRKNDIAFKLNTDMATIIRRSLEGGKNGAHWETIVGYTVEELKKHLKNKFTGGMGWENYGKGKNKWNIDHIIPIASFNITSYDCQEFKDCWALDNLQPLWQPRNFEKGTKPMELKYLIR